MQTLIRRHIPIPPAVLTEAKPRPDTAKSLGMGATTAATSWPAACIFIAWRQKEWS